MAGLTRRELKRDEFRTSFEQLEEFVKQRWTEIVSIVGLLIVVVGSAAGLKLYMDRQQEQANAELGKSLTTFRAYVGAASPESLGSNAQSFPTAQDKYKKALEQFGEVTRRFPRTKAAAIARYHMGVCQAQLGDQAAATKTLQEASRASDRDIAALAQLALAGELAKSGKVEDAAKLYQQLADHPSSTVPRATALLAMADAYRASRPSQSRQIYEQMAKEFSSEASVEGYLKQQVTSLSK